MRHRVLVVDDEAAILEMLCAALAERYEVDAVASGEEALLQIARAEPYALVVTDMIMQRVNGIEVLAAAEKKSSLTVRVLLTGDRKHETAVAAVNRGHIFRFLDKPFSVKQLYETVQEAVQHYDVAIAEQRLLDGTLRNSIGILMEVASTIDPPSFELSQRLRRTIRKFARELRLPSPWELEMTAALARVGTATLPGSLLRRRGSDQLSEIEKKLLARVPEISSELIQTIPRLETVAAAIRYQGKNFDGSGTPADSIAGENIPLAARILKIFTDRAQLELNSLSGASVRKTMEARTGIYDPTLLAESFTCFPERIFPDVSRTAKVHMVMAGGLKPNQIVVKEIKTEEGLVLVAAGSGLTAMMIHRISNHLALRLISQPFFVQDPPAPTKTALPFPSKPSA